MAGRGQQTYPYYNQNAHGTCCCCQSDWPSCGALQERCLCLIIAIICTIFDACNIFVILIWYIVPRHLYFNDHNLIFFVLIACWALMVAADAFLIYGCTVCASPKTAKVACILWLVCVCVISISVLAFWILSTHVLIIDVIWLCWDVYAICVVSCYLAFLCA